MLVVLLYWCVKVHNHHAHDVTITTNNNWFVNTEQQQHNNL